MAFEDYWGEVEKLKVLPYMAIVQLPASLSNGVSCKKRTSCTRDQGSRNGVQSFGSVGTALRRPRPPAFLKRFQMAI